MTISRSTDGGGCGLAPRRRATPPSVVTAHATKRPAWWLVTRRFLAFFLPGRLAVMASKCVASMPLRDAEIIAADLSPSRLIR